MLPENADRLLSNVGERNFKLHMGTEIRSLRELTEALDIMSEDSFRHHVNSVKNDFANWVNDVVGDAELAKSIRHLKTRREILGRVRSRVNYLEGKRNQNVICPREFLTCGATDFALGAIIGFVIGVIFASII